MQHKTLRGDADRVTKAALQHGKKGLGTSTANDLPGILWAQGQSFRAEPSTKGKAAKLFVLEDGTRVGEDRVHAARDPAGGQRGPHPEERYYWGVTTWKGGARPRSQLQ